MTADKMMVPAATHGTKFGAIGLLRRHWSLLGSAGIAGAVVAIAYYLLSPKWYQAEIMIVPKESSMGGLAAVGSMLGQLPLDVGGSALMSSDAERIAGVLMSRSTGDAVIAKFDLMSRYGVDKIEHARENLWSLCAASVERKSNTVVLTCEDKDPVVARDMAEYFGKVGDEGFRRIATSLAREEREFLEKRTTEARLALDKASQALRSFQEINKIIDLPEQSKAVVSAMAALEGDLISKRIQLSYLSGFVSRSELSFAQVNRQIQVLSDELQVRQQGAPASPGVERRPGSALFPPAMDVPALHYQMEGLYRELKVRETVFFLLSERFESLRIDEARDLSTFVVFDHAVLPTHRIRPRGRVVPMGIFAGLALGVVLILLPAWWRDLAARQAAERTT